MRRFWRDVKVVNGSSSRLGLKSWSSTGDTVFISSTEAILEFLRCGLVALVGMRL
jgi:hypothetical protein